jgi:hypothetical protein
MKKWLERMLAPTVVLWFYALVYGIAWSLGLERGTMPRQFELAASVALPLVLASWVLTDARKRGRGLCYDYGSFVYFAWAVLVPVYLFQTRGVRAFLTLLCFAGIWLAAAVVAGLLALLREYVL